MTRFASLKISILILPRLHELGFDTQVLQGVEDVAFTRRSRLLVPDITDSATTLHTVRVNKIMSISEVNEVFNSKSSELESHVAQLCAHREEQIVFEHMRNSSLRFSNFDKHDLERLLVESKPSKLFFGRDIFTAMTLHPSLEQAYQIKPIETSDEVDNTSDLEDSNLMEWGTHLGSLNLEPNTIELFTDSLRYPHCQVLKPHEMLMVRSFPGSYQAPTQLSYSLLPEGDEQFKLECWYDIKLDLPEDFEASLCTMIREEAHE